jgi:hypothetical protein
MRILWQVNRAVGIAISILGIWFLAGCYTVPEIGRRLINFVSNDHETQMGAVAFQ